MLEPYTERVFQEDEAASAKALGQAQAGHVPEWRKKRVWLAHNEWRGARELRLWWEAGVMEAYGMQSEAWVLLRLQ